MSTLYIRPPPKSATDSISRWLELACPFALVSGGGSIEREGQAPLSALSGAAAGVQRVVLLLAGSDVTLLRVKTPPLPSAKLKSALPGMVEDMLLADPSGCAVVAGGLSGGQRTVAVMQRDWLELLTRTLMVSGACRIAALPAQLCLSPQHGLQVQTGNVTAAISEYENGIDLMLHFAEQEGIGVAIATGTGHAAGYEGHEVPELAAIHTLCILVPEAPITLYVPKSAMRAYQEAINRADVPNKRINVLADNWQHWIAGASAVSPDLLAGKSVSVGNGLDWRKWRWPTGLAAAILLTHAVALNADWWRMKREASTLRAAMVQTYRSAYPKETVILDPVAQMQQKIGIARRNAGLPSPDDFTALLAGFGEAWNRVMPDKTVSVIKALEYRERSLFVHLKPDMAMPVQQIKAALAELHLSIDQVSPQADIWKIGSAE